MLSSVWPLRFVCLGQLRCFLSLILFAYCTALMSDFCFCFVSGKWWFRMGRLLRKHQVWTKNVMWLKLYCKIREHFLVSSLNTNLSLSHCRLRKINTYSDCTPQVLIVPKNRQSLKLCFEIIPFRMSAQSKPSFFFLRFCMLFKVDKQNFCVIWGS